MKTRLFFVLIALFTLSCKNTAKDKISITKVEIKQTNHSPNKVKTFQEKLIGRKYHFINEIDEFKNSTSSGIFPIGNLRLNENGFGVEKIYLKEIFTYLIFSKVTNHSANNDNSTEYEILDILNMKEQSIVSIIMKNDTNLFINSSYLESNFDDEILVIAKYEDDEHEYYETIYKAWRADRKTGKIIKISTTGIKVENMDYGL